MRTRNTSYSEPAVQVALSHWQAAGTYQEPTKVNKGNDTYQTYVPYAWTKSYQDEVVSSFYRRRANGEIFCNTMISTEIHTWRDPLFIDEKRRKWEWQGWNPPLQVVFQGGWNMGYLAPTWFEEKLPASETLGISPSTVRDIAVTGAYAKANEQDVEGLVMVAEGKKTIQSLSKITWRAIRILRMLKRLNFKGLSAELTPRELSNRWMEGRYAIRPLVKDMCDVVKAISRDRNNVPLRQTYRSGASATAEKTVNGVVVYNFQPYYNHLGVTKISRNISARSGVLAAIEEISEATIWGLNQPFTALWELVPFSFVVDWFFNVGKTIASWTPRYGLRTLASWVTVTDTVVRSCQSQGTVLGPWGIDPYDGYIWEHSCVSSNASVNQTIVTKTRVPNPSRSILPTFQVRLDAAKLLDLAIMGKRFIR